MGETGEMGEMVPADFLMADGGIWPLLIFWAVFALIGRAAAANKKKAMEARLREQAGGEPATPERAPQGGLLGELKRAMEELKRAELEQRGQLQQRTQIEVFEQPADQEELRKRERARQVLEKKQAEALQKRAEKQAQRRVQPLPDAADMSSEETVVSLEGKDYDNEAEAIIARRRAAAERQVRDESSQEELSTLQRARREARQDVTIGSQAEHDEWHAQLAAGAPEDATRRGANPLARFTDGSLRSALILGEILGRPRGERSQDG